MKHDPLAYECHKCCISCDEDKETCKYYKARRNATRRELYHLKKLQKEK